MKSASQSEACKCKMCVTAGKVGTWPEFLWRGQIPARVRRHLCCWTARDSPPASFTLVNVSLCYFVFILNGCLAWRMVIIITADSCPPPPLDALRWCTETELLITDFPQGYINSKNKRGNISLNSNYSQSSKSTDMEVSLPSWLPSLTAADC